MQDDVLDNFYKIAEATFACSRSRPPLRTSPSRALEESWFLYERGFLRLVTYEGLRTRAKRRPKRAARCRKAERNTKRVSKALIG